MELELHVRGGEEQRPFLRVPIIFVEFLENTFVFVDETWSIFQTQILFDRLKESWALKPGKNSSRNTLGQSCATTRGLLIMCQRRLLHRGKPTIQYSFIACSVSSASLIIWIGFIPRIYVWRVTNIDYIFFSFSINIYPCLLQKSFYHGSFIHGFTTILGRCFGYTHGEWEAGI